MRSPWTDRVRLISWSLPLLTGGGLALSWVPFGGTWSALIAFAPTAYFLGGGMARTKGVGLSTREILLAGFLLAVPAYAVGLAWVVPSLEWRSAVPHGVYGAVVVSLSLCAAATVLGSVHWSRITRVPLCVTLPLCWAGLEWSLARLPGMPFAWLRVGGALAWLPPLSGIAEVVGMSGLTAWTVFVGACLGSAVRDVTSPRVRVAKKSRGYGFLGWAKRLQLALWVGLLVGPPMFGVIRDGGYRDRSASGSVLAVQTGRVETYAFDPEPIVDRARESSVRAVVFPEVVFPRVNAEVRGSVGDLSERTGIPVLVGTGMEDGGQSFNASHTFLPGQSQELVVAKRRLVPGIERRLPWLLRVAGVQDHGYDPGRDPGVVPLGPDLRVGVLVCYDSAFPSLVRQDNDAGADFAIVQSNDDWLDPTGAFRETIAYWQHATHAVVRAVESRSGVVQVAATGWTFSVDPSGRLRGDRPPVGERAIAVLPFWTGERSTVFQTLGDVLGLAGALLLGVSLFDWRRRAVRTPGKAASSNG